NIPTREEIALEQQLKSQLDLIDSQLRTLDATKDAQQIQTLWAERKLVAGKLEFLKTEVNNRGLNNEFIPRNQTFLGPSSPGPISPNILQYQQLLNQIR
ncbi:MAG TPA: hypothetical protein VG713_05160, partial [Pirellulales bacterium]|nr:hypothetical protein [Pirellulales bacterium]